MSKLTSHLLIAFIGIFLLSSCSIFRGTKIEKFYHNVTARYNGYFNAHEKMKEIEEKLRQSQVDNYEEVLDVYEFADEAAGKQVTPDADIVIKKCTKVIQKHKISNMVDDCYFLMAKAYFYKRDYFTAIETFTYVNTKYAGNELAYLSTIWIALCKMQLEKYEEAKAIFTLLDSDDKFPEDLFKELWLAKAALAIKDENYLNAISNLSKAVEEEHERHLKNRYYYILGQLYMLTDQYNEASQVFEELIKRNPEYEMAFNSKINLARAYRSGSNKSVKDVKSYLEKMLKDDKNIDYFGQIYFELAQLELKQGNVEIAKQYLEKSIATSKDANQKGLSYLALGEYYYNKKNYLSAGYYYDSTISNLNQNYEDYEDIAYREKILDEFIDNYKIIQQEDSLQKLASLPRNELDKKIDDIIEKEQEEKDKQSQQVQDNQQMPFNNSNMPNMMNQDNNPQDLNAQNNPFLNTGNNREWYFYNPTALGIGYSDFLKKWGNRPLEDDWRRISKKKDLISDQANNQENEQDSISETETDSAIADQLANVPEGKRKYYAGIPFLESQKAASNARIKEALIDLGKLYYKDLDDYDKAIETFQEFITRFPDDDDKVICYYYLNKIYSAKSDYTKADEYKNKVLKEYPETSYARLLKNPPSSILDSDKNPELEKLYAEAFQKYQAGNCASLTAYANEANQKFSDNYLRPKFDYLYILCKGKDTTREAFRELLVQYKEKYPASETTEHATNVISYLDELKQKEKTSQISEKVKGSSFSFKEDTPHYYIMVFSVREKESLMAKQRLYDYNKKYYQLKNLTINDHVYGDNQQMLVVKGFANKKEALDYLQSIEKDEDFKKKLNLKHFEDYVITVNDYNKVMREKKLDEYKKVYSRLN